ncbi:uncharacterized protein BO97DRAFT_472253 [Aspergillus homomorphus CBS 101889]|uniref:Uncharacterized protein n=1 Tax=Aspergillus homomorphus (strain CBS 101889) TaxID=1450537 RepID=A0A395HSD4_ASPHC|nr:hypothetical protein BO97DRAFT_472253 [Aspergillus homomorphus CBS 101889]RAL09768.1 hypothetical protein BO97DRAFT_472253 [Aspergillus homomorphus CBS 101889]
MAVDCASIRFGETSGNIVPIFLNEHTVAFTGRTTPETYGELLHWDDLPPAFDWMHTQREVHPGLGLVGLEIQEKLYSFLVKCCMQLLCEYTCKDLLKDDLPVQPEPLAMSTGGAGLNLLAVVAAEALFRLPANLDLSPLREDPGYFAEALQDRMEHRLEKLLDVRGQAHPELKAPATKMWDRVIGDVISEAYLHFGPPSSTSGLPASPPVRQFFYCDTPQHRQDSVFTRSKLEWVADKRRARLSWIYDTLCHENTRFLAGLPTLMDEMKRLIQNEKHLSLFQPWAAQFETIIAEKEDNLRDDYTKNIDQWSMFIEPLAKAKSSALGSPIDNRFHYPVDKRRTRDTTAAIQSAEAALDRFWRSVDSIFITKDGLSQHGSTRHLLTQNRSLRRTPDWVEPAAKDVEFESDPSLEGPALPLSQLYYELERRTQRTVKTCGAAATPSSPATTSTTATLTPSELEDQQPTFTVDKRAYKVFNTLFYIPSRKSQPGEIPWTDFLHAMSATGFEVEKLFGSIWQFTPTRLDVERSIQFPEPHPSGKIPFRTARRHARRLFRAYGWHAGMLKLDV